MSNNNDHRSKKRCFQAWLPKEEDRRVSEVKKLFGVTSDRDVLNKLIDEKLKKDS